MLVACDPDTAAPSYAYFRDGELQSVCYQTEGPRVAPPYPREALLVIEGQYLSLVGKKVGVGEYQQIRVSDILALAWAAGECSMHFDRAERVRPSTWKGNVSKEIHHEWVKAELTEAERFAVGKRPKYQLREILDAVGIGLWKIGRLR